MTPVTPVALSDNSMGPLRATDAALADQLNFVATGAKPRVRERAVRIGGRDHLPRTLTTWPVEFDALVGQGLPGRVHHQTADLPVQWLRQGI
jgi:hypothetical protein